MYQAKLRCPPSSTSNLDQPPKYPASITLFHFNSTGGVEKYEALELNGRIYLNSTQPKVSISVLKFAIVNFTFNWFRQRDGPAARSTDLLTYLLQSTLRRRWQFRHGVTPTWGKRTQNLARDFAKQLSGMGFLGRERGVGSSWVIVYFES